MVDVSIVLVNYYSSEFLEKCLGSIYERTAGISFEIIVVDNSCNESEKKKLLEIQSKLKFNLLVADTNLGFGKANNYAAKKADGIFLFFLNVDTFLLNNAIYELYDFASNKNDDVILGSNLFTPSLHPNHSFFPFVKNLKSEKKVNSLLFHIKRLISKKRFDFNYSNDPLKISGYVCGASLFIKKEIFYILGGFDSEIFMYAEEALLCYRFINEIKGTIYNVPSSTIVHFEGGTFSSLSNKRMKMIVDGNSIYYKKIFGDTVLKKYLLFKTRSHYFKYVLSLICFKKSLANNHKVAFLSFKQKYKDTFKNKHQNQNK